MTLPVLLAIISSEARPAIGGSGDPLHPTILAGADKIRTACFSVDGGSLAGSGADGKVYFWDVKTAKQSNTFDSAHEIQTLTYLPPDGKSLVIDQGAAGLKMLDLAAMTAHDVPASGDAAALQIVSHKGTMLARVCPAQPGWIIDLFNLRTNVKGVQIKCPAELKTLDFSSDDLKLAGQGNAAGKDGAEALTIIWDAKTGQVSKTTKGDFSDEPGTTPCIHFLPGGKQVAYWKNPRALVLADASSGSVQQETKTARVMEKPVFSPDGKLVAALDATASLIYLFDNTTGAVIKIKDVNKGVRPLCFSNDGKMFACADGASILVWNISAGTNLTASAGAASPP